MSVTVVRSGQTFSLSKQITVNARTGFAFTAVSATKVQNGFTTPGRFTLLVPSPPQPGGRLGMFYLEQSYSFQTALVNDGPNQGFKYVTSVTNSSDNGTGQVNTAYYYLISPDLENIGSAFYKAQCGNYDPQMNTGFISGAQLLANTMNHEAGAEKNSHYKFYVDAQNKPENNLGVVAEKGIGPPSESAEAFKIRFERILSERIGTIETVAGVEPCGRKDVALDKDCQFRGCINYADAQGNYFPCTGAVWICPKPPSKTEEK